MRVHRSLHLPSLQYTACTRATVIFSQTTISSSLVPAGPYVGSGEFINALPVTYLIPIP